MGTYQSAALARPFYRRAASLVIIGALPLRGTRHAQFQTAHRVKAGLGVGGAGPL
ncbi:hypothetical protein [Nocardia australiensis]|uniref:hypothetical protein n=1 Tax=Nocardia australiensis TaxID=2887191 RepID=UPI001D1327F8|nr:hypothetical protein [Nocardia australiensis]